MKTTRTRVRQSKILERQLHQLPLHHPRQLGQSLMTMTIWDGDMSGSLLSLKEAAQALFGESNRNSIARVRRLFEKQNLKTIREGGKIYIHKSVLDTAFGAEIEQTKTVVKQAFGINDKGEVIPLVLKDRG